MRKPRYRIGDDVRTRYTIWLTGVEIPADTLLSIIAVTKDEVLVEYQGQQVWVPRINLQPDYTPSMFPEIDPPRQLSLM